ncbi:transporter substrate-binding domain-containing protein [Pseudovibrio sp. Tun.PSC04-5.I4]|uniref:transporter substrate-binding domain-containing protein n=1 Tax=Pseudovibrio sp. Tun.PSC04-5.I4 TaxID=1798213 RepID=UPI000887E39A|nr:transporter substrate-binding domain-containing protein [Pseudovibrio sp. Tun.PSC04-5.I4]SDQ18567.1 amino acid ABC transporter substrate-binding protein, PAAT family [Pseudovibrio sp. Tun.PSC04-5.I4]
MTYKFNLSGLVLGVLAAVSLAGPAQAQQARKALSQDSVIEEIKERGAIKIGLSLFKPWSMRDKNGELIGFEPDVGRELAKDMGVDAEFIPVSWDGIIPALVSGKFDVIISGMTVTTQRNLTVNFTTPYAYSGNTIYSNISMTKDFTEEDYNKSTTIFAARRGGTPAAAIARAFPNAQLLQFDEDGAATQEVLNGNAHATMGAEPTPTYDVTKYPEVLHIPFDKIYSQSGEAFALRKGDPDGLSFFNNWIAAKRREGFLKERQDFWFRSVSWEEQVNQ